MKVLIYFSLVALAIFSSLPNKTITSIWPHSSNNYISPLDTCKCFEFSFLDFSFSQGVSLMASWEDFRIRNQWKFFLKIPNRNAAFFLLLLCLTECSKVSMYNTIALWMKQDSKFSEIKYIYIYLKKNMLRSVQWQMYYCSEILMIISIDRVFASFYIKKFLDQHFKN